jgi:hypothetical protein
VKLFAAEKVAIGYAEPADPERPEGPKLVVTYAKGKEIPQDRPIANLVGLVEQGYIRIEGEATAAEAADMILDRLGVK